MEHAHRLRFRCAAALFLAFALAATASAGPDDQAADEHQHDPPAGSRMQMNMSGMYLMNLASGTSMSPQSWPMPMLMPRIGSWNLMLMGQAFAVETQQSG